MAASNSKSTLLYCTHDSNYPYTLEASFSQGTTSIEGNYSDVTCTARLSSWETNWSSSYNSYLRIYWHDNRENYDRLVAEISMKNCSKNSDYYASDTIRVYHKDDGTLSGYALATFEKGGTSAYAPSSGSVDTDWTALWAIARASTPSIDGTIYTGTTVTVKTNRKSTSFTHNLSYSFGSASGSIGTGVGDTVSWAIPANLAAQITNSDKGTVTITCDTYNGSTYIGTKTYTKELNVNTSVKPSISASSVVDGNSAVLNLGWNVFILDKSYPVVSITAAGSQGSTIKEYTFSITQNNVLTSTKTAPNVSELNNLIRTSVLTAGDALFSLTVKDTRNRISDAIAIHKTIRSYTNPTITDFKVARCKSSSDLTEDDEGTSAKISASGNITNVKNNNNTSVNTLYVKTRYRTSPNGAWSSLTNLPGGVSGYSFDITGANSKPLAGTFPTTNKFDIEIYIYDAITLAESGWNGSGTPTEAQLSKLTKSAKSILTGFDLMHFHRNGKSVSFGKKSEAGSTDKWFEVRMDKIALDGSIFVGNSTFENYIKQIVRDTYFPVGKLYITDGPENPNNTIGGTWVRISSRYIYASSDTSNTDWSQNSNESSYYGIDALSHTLVESEVPKHSHTKGSMVIWGNVYYPMYDDGATLAADGAFAWGGEPRTRTWQGANGGPASRHLAFNTNYNGGAGWSGSTSEYGGGGGHAHSVAWHSCHIWKRTA